MATRSADRSDDCVVRWYPSRMKASWDRQTLFHANSYMCLSSQVLGYFAATTRLDDGEERESFKEKTIF